MTSGLNARQSRPGFEALEDRRLLSVGALSTPQTTGFEPRTPSPLRRLQYTAPGGGQVVLQVFGVGQMNGTTVDPNGVLNLRFSGTNQETGIIARVVGGTGQAPLGSVRSLNLPADSLTGVGGNLIDILDLRNFNLISGGRINLTSGVHDLSLNSVAGDTQINLREVPENTTVTTSGSAAGTTSAASTTGASTTSTTGTTLSGITNGGPTSSVGTTIAGTTAGNPIGGTTTGNTISGTNTSPGGSTSSSGAAGNNVTTTGQSFATTTTSTSTTSGSTTTVTVLPASTTQNGQTLTYSYDQSGVQTLSGVSGQFVPGANIVLPNITYGSPNPQPGAPPAPPGVKIAIKTVNGPARGTQLLGHAQLFGYDPVAGALIRFDATTGARLQTISVAGILPDPKTEAGVALARVNGTLDVLISDGSTVHAFNALTGALAGSFSLAGLNAADGLNHPLRLGTFDGSTVIGDPAGGTFGLGLLQPIDVAASLTAGKVQLLLGASGKPVPAYSLTREFGLTGGFSGVPGSTSLFATGGGHFDPFQPNQFLLGVSSLGFGRVPTGVASFGETARSAVTGLNGQTIPTNSVGATGSSLNDALGSVDQNLALFTGQATTPTGGTVDVVTLLNPVSFAETSTIALADSNPLTSLSGSFRPALAGAALVDVQGNTQSFKASSTLGLVFSGEGNVNLVKIARATDTTIIGYPFGHAAIPHRTNVAIVSTTRSVGGRNGVAVLPNAEPTGPLSLPTA